MRLIGSSTNNPRTPDTESSPPTVISATSVTSSAAEGDRPNAIRFTGLGSSDLLLESLPACSPYHPLQQLPFSGLSVAGNMQFTEPASRSGPSLSPPPDSELASSHSKRKAEQSALEGFVARRAKAEGRQDEKESKRAVNERGADAMSVGEFMDRTPALMVGSPIYAKVVKILEDMTGCSNLFERSELLKALPTLFSSGKGLDRETMRAFSFEILDDFGSDLGVGEKALALSVSVQIRRPGTGSHRTSFPCEPNPGASQQGIDQRRWRVCATKRRTGAVGNHIAGTASRNLVRMRKVQSHHRGRVWSLAHDFTQRFV